MKRIIVILLSLILLLAGCQNNDKIIGVTMNDIKAQYDLHICLNSLYVFKKDAIYLVVIEENSVAQKKVEFSLDRNYRNAVGITLLKSQNISQYLNLTLDEIVENFGEFHTDVGSGFYIPAYITEDGYLVCFGIEDNVVYEVTVRDLLTNKIVEKKWTNQGTVL